MLDDSEVFATPRVVNTPNDKESPWSFTTEERDAVLGDGDWSRYAAAHAWYDGNAPDPDDDGYPDRKGDYKLPHHKMKDGKLTLFFAGVEAAMESLLGARGGVDIPQDEHRKVYDHLAAHYRAFDEEPPEYHEPGENASSNEPAPVAGSSISAQGGTSMSDTAAFDAMKAEAQRLSAALEAANQTVREHAKTIEGLNAKITDLEPLARDGETYKNDLVDECVQAGVRDAASRGAQAAFNPEVWRKAYSAMGVGDLKQIRDSFNASAARALGITHTSTENPKLPSNPAGETSTLSAEERRKAARSALSGAGIAVTPDSK